MNNKKFFIIIGILVLAAAVGLSSYLPTRFESESEVKMADFPKDIGDWKGIDIELSNRDFEILETTNLVMRKYQDSKGNSVYLYIVYSGNNRNVIHPPEICYTGSGGAIIEKSVIAVTASIQANKFIIEDKNSRQLVMYWFKSGNFSTYNYLKQQFKIVTDRMLRKETSGALIRISTNIKGPDTTASLELIRQFAAEIQPLLSKYVP